MKLWNWMGYESETPTKNILALSGGGVRGLTSLTILEEIEKRVGKKAGEIFELTAATSVGCLISSLLNLEDPEHPGTRKYSAKDLSEIMEPKIKLIFHRTYLNEFESGNSLIAPKYTSDGMCTVLNELFGETRAKDLLGNYSFASLDTTNFKQGYFSFTKSKAQTNPFWQDLKVKDMIQGVTAAQTYFYSKKIVLDREYNIVDAGPVENNPSVRAYSEGKRIFNCGENMTLLSIGTGCVDFHLQETNWGSLHWASWILPLTFTGQDSAVRSLAANLLNLDDQPQKYYPIQFDLQPGKDVLDDASDENIAYLKEVAKTWIDSDAGETLLYDVCRKFAR